MKYACQYAIVHFMPYTETGEFANVGIVLMCPQAGYFDFKLLNRVRRITTFFEELDVAIYRNARKAFEGELKRLRSTLVPALAQSRDTQSFNKPMAQHLFAELVRQREAIIRFDEVRVVLTEDPAAKLDDLFGHYVGRSFATKTYQEQMVEKQVHQVLRAADLVKVYREHTLGNTAYHARFPFVKMNENGQVALRAIKPLHLAHDDPTQLFDHGWEWVGKVRKLKRENLLPHAVLFAVNPPAAVETERLAAYNEIVTELQNEDVTVLSYQSSAAILEFAVAGTA